MSYQENQYGQLYGNQHNQFSLEQQLMLQQKKGLHRRTVDHGNNMTRWHLKRKLGDTMYNIGAVRPESSYLIDLMPTPAYRNDNIPTNPAIFEAMSKFVHLSTNKTRHAIQTVKWTPEGRRLVVAAHSGEVTIWNGMTFNFETIMQAHDVPILALNYSHNDEWLISGDQDGVLKYWQSNFNNVNIIEAHKDAVRDIAFSPNDSKFVTCSDDSSAKIWNFNNGKEERTLSGHHWDVKSADWHPDMGLVATGSKDNLLKLWDPRAASCVTTLHGFKHTVSKTRFQTSGMKRMLASTSRDRSCRIFDLRTMRDFIVIRDFDTEATSVGWHPFHAGLISVGTHNGALHHYVLDNYVPNNDESDGRAFSSRLELAPIEAIHKVPYAHERVIHAIEYHPLGHLLCTAGNDRSARFWSRARPNDPVAWKEPLYTNEKEGPWYYAANNNVNAVLPDKEVSSVSSNVYDSGNKDIVPGLRNYQQQKSSGIPGLLSY